MVLDDKIQVINTKLGQIVFEIEGYLGENIDVSDEEWYFQLQISKEEIQMVRETLSKVNKLLSAVSFK